MNQYWPLISNLARIFEKQGVLYLALEWLVVPLSYESPWTLITGHFKQYPLGRCEDWFLGTGLSNLKCYFDKPLKPGQKSPGFHVYGFTAYGFAEFKRVDWYDKAYHLQHVLDTRKEKSKQSNGEKLLNKPMPSWQIFTVFCTALHRCNMFFDEFTLVNASLYYVPLKNQFSLFSNIIPTSSYSLLVAKNFQQLHGTFQRILQIGPSNKTNCLKLSARYDVLLLYTTMLFSLNYLISQLYGPFLKHPFMKCPGWSA